MREAGLLATVNTDDPALTNLDFGKEYREIATALDLPFAEMLAVALDGIAASWLSGDEKRSLRRHVEREIVLISAATH
jgi:adenosine deaminase